MSIQWPTNNTTSEYVAAHQLKKRKENMTTWGRENEPWFFLSLFLLLLRISKFTSSLLTHIVWVTGNHYLKEPPEYIYKISPPPNPAQAFCANLTYAVAKWQVASFFFWYKLHFFPKLNSVYFTSKFKQKVQVLHAVALLSTYFTKIFQRKPTIFMESLKKMASKKKNAATLEVFLLKKERNLNKIV